MIELENIVNNLKSSPLFNMSLSSKELFHSNFLAWIIDNYRMEFMEKFCEIANLQNSHIIELKREFDNFDIIICLENKNIYIENKVKSSPNIEQLLEYRKQNTKDIFILLSLMKPSFDITPSGWKYIGYDKIVSIIDFISSQTNNNYHKELLIDYRFVLANLVNASNYLLLNIKEAKFNFRNEIFKSFQSIRMNDFYTKHIYNQLSFFIYQELLQKISKDNVFIGSWYSIAKHPVGSILIQTNYQNGKGILHLDFVYQEDLLIGIMLDGHNYDHYIKNWNGSKNEKLEFANKLNNNKLWFNFNCKFEIAKMKKDYNRYGENMLYKYAHIPQELFVKELIDIMTNEIIEIKEKMK